LDPLETEALDFSIFRLLSGLSVFDVGTSVWTLKKNGSFLSVPVRMCTFVKIVRYAHQDYF
jgi:hypothetical protein